jgi:hypothetical protein
VTSCPPSPTSWVSSEKRELSLSLSSRLPSRVAASLSLLFAQEEERCARKGGGESAGRVKSQEAVVVDHGRFSYQVWCQKSGPEKKIALMSGNPKLKTLVPGALFCGTTLSSTRSCKWLKLYPQRPRPGFEPIAQGMGAVARATWLTPLITGWLPAARSVCIHLVVGRQPPHPLTPSVAHVPSGCFFPLGWFLW